MISDLLIHTLEVYRRTGRTDRFGQPVDANPSVRSGETPTATYPCRLSSPRGGRVMQERSRDVLEVGHRVFVLSSADVNENDSVRVLDRSGSVLLTFSQVVRKSSIADSLDQHHVELEVLTQRGPS